MNIIGLNGHSMDDGLFLKNNQILSVDSENMVIDVIRGHKAKIDELIGFIFGKKNRKDIPQSILNITVSRNFSADLVSSLWTLEALAFLLDMEDYQGAIIVKNINEAIFNSIAPYNKLGTMDTNIIDYASQKFFYDAFFNDYIPRHVMNKVKKQVDELDFSIIREANSTIIAICFSRGACQLSLNFDAVNAEYPGKASVMQALGFISSAYLFSQYMAQIGHASQNTSGLISTNETRNISFHMHMIDYSEEEDEDDEYQVITMYGAFSMRYHEEEIISGVHMLDMTMPENPLQIN